MKIDFFSQIWIVCSIFCTFLQKLNPNERVVFIPMYLLPPTFHFPNPPSRPPPNPLPHCLHHTLSPLKHTHTHLTTPSPIIPTLLLPIPHPITFHVHPLPQFTVRKILYSRVGGRWSTWGEGGELIGGVEVLRGGKLRKGRWEVIKKIRRYVNNQPPQREGWGWPKRLFNMGWGIRREWET